MLQIILVLTILGYSYYLYRSRSKDGDYIFGGVMISLFVIILLTMIGNTVFLKEQFRTNCSTEIISLSNSQSISGSFFLGSGVIDSTEYYFTFKKDSDGAFNRWKIPAYSARLFLTNSQSPKIIWQRIYYGAPKWLTFLSRSEDRDTIYDIYVPENTIIQKFEVK